MTPRGLTIVVIVVSFSVACCALSRFTDGADESNSDLLNPAGWGDDHVRKSIPEYITGDECLFCHRDIGKTWQSNRHQRTLRPVLGDSPTLKALKLDAAQASMLADVELLLGSKRHTRFLKRSKKYGHLEMMSTKMTHSKEAHQLVGPMPPHWDRSTFNERCAGCHTTAVESDSKAFSATSLDCFVCHGNVHLDHTKKTARVVLSKDHRNPRMVMSICGQCHLRGGESRSTGRPYPNQFVPEDNLFRDFHVTLSLEHLSKLGPGDRHVFENTREVVLVGKTGTTCLTCHDIHAASTTKHQELEDSSICFSCHIREQPKSQVKPMGRSSKTCDY